MALSAASCATRQQIETKYFPVIPSPVIPDAPTAPINLHELLPPPVVASRKTTTYWNDVCDRYQDPEESPAEIMEETQLSRSAACDWAIYGFTTQGGLTLREIFNLMAGHEERNRAHIRFLERLIESLYQVTRSKGE
jgi:hypothetical protein